MKSLGLVEDVQRQLEQALLDGRYVANSRLPSERVLAEQFGVSRNTVREATQRLVARGLLRSRPGAGVYVSDQLRTGAASPWGHLVADHPAVLADVLEFRRVWKELLPTMPRSAARGRTSADTGFARGTGTGARRRKIGR
jgi:GntR family transcriptional repressor for pyruvate dehydrogenase complex